LQSVRLASPRIGELVVEQYQVPDRPPAAGILVAADVTILSAGTEIANYLGRTAERPPSQVTPYHPRYSFAGTVLAVGEDVEQFSPGDRIAGPISRPRDRGPAGAAREIRAHTGRRLRSGGRA
jgi:NADPH:quinone reductase-like Zn-dependent oxidoreductase